MTTKNFILSLLTIFCFQQVILSQYNDDDFESIDKHELELKDYFWNKCDSSFKISEIPEKWNNESAVIIAKRIEYSVKKKSFSNKLLEKQYTHFRVKLLDNRSIEDFSKFSFNNSSRRYRGAFSFETIKYYVGIKVEKSNGQIEEVNLDDAVEEKIANRQQQYKYNKLAIPNLQIGDIVDIYRCIERKFPVVGFHEFAPLYYELPGEYPIMQQTIHVDILRNCYLNGKAINGAPELKCVGINTNDNIYSYELVDKNREKLIPENWVNSSIEIPALKLQAYYAGNSNSYLLPGYQSFFAPITKYKTKINTDALGDFSNSLLTNIKNAYSPYRSVYLNTFRYLKQLNKEKQLSTEELAKEAFYFVREFWYQQYFHSSPQVFYFNQLDMDIYTATIIISAALIKLKRPHNIVFIVPKNYTRESDLIFLGELSIGIKTLNGEKPVYITSIGPNNNFNDIPINCKGSTGYCSAINKNSTISLITKTILPEDKSTQNTCYINSTANFISNFDSLRIKSKINLSGAEKFSWDTVMFVTKTLRDEFNADKYGMFIKDLNISNTNSKLKKSKELDELFKKQDEERKRKLKEKIKEAFSVEDVSLNNFNIINSGRWEDTPNLIIELDYTIPVNCSKIGNSMIFSTECLTSHVGKLLEPERNFNIYFPYKKEIKHRITIEGFDVKNSSGYEKFNNEFDIDNLSFNSQYEISNDKLVVTSKEILKQNEFEKEKWKAIIDFQKTIYEFKNVKLKIPVQ